MATADVAKLIASLSLQDKGFTKGLSNAEKKLGQFESTSFRVGQHIGSGLKAGADNLAKLGAVAVGGIALAVKSGLDDLAELESAITSVDGAIETMGQTGKITGKQVADWANEIESEIDAAFDDKAITAAAATLLRFGKVTPENLRPALEVTADLAAKTGDVDSAASQLAKALVDPTKAAGKLAKAGVVLTKKQQDQIKAMTEAGDVAGAQAVLIDAVAESTAGAAKAMAGPYQDAINKTNDALEDGKKALAIGFLPVITKVADKLSKIVADPKALASIQSFGTTLAGGLDHLIGIAENLPWEAIGTSLQIAGMGAKAVLDAFVSLPPWVQTAVLTGWGLNKLTGGALSGIVSELAKGAIKGVLGINAGHVTVNAATVSGVGGVPGVGGAPAAGGRLAGLKNLASSAIKLVLPVGLGLVIGQEIARALGANVPDDPLTAIESLLTTYVINDKSNDEKVHGTLKGGLAEQKKQQQTAAQILAATERAESRAAQDAARVASQIAAGDTRTELAIAGVSAATTAGLSGVKSATQGVTASVNAKDLSVSVANTIVNAVTVSVRETIKTTTTHKQYARYLS